MRISKRIPILVAAFLLLAATPSYSQLFKGSDAAPQGAVVYSLPQTSIKVTLKVSLKNFSAGPYAAFSEKYLGVSAERSSKKSCVIEEVELTHHCKQWDHCCDTRNHHSHKKYGKQNVFSLVVIKLKAVSSK